MTRSSRRSDDAATANASYDDVGRLTTTTSDRVCAATGASSQSAAGTRRHRGRSSSDGPVQIYRLDVERYDDLPTVARLIDD